MRKREAGFTLIEIILTLVLIGILSVFTGLFMTSFLSSYFLVKNNADTAMKAQMAMDRISMELRDISPISASVPSPVSVLTPNTLITYTNQAGVVRTIKWIGSNLFLSTPTDNILIDGVQAFQLSATYRNVYNIAADDVAFIDVGFTVAGVPAFSVRIFPRNRIPQPP
jgi:prepilin-type N-terminal cleavage/methylation domain-containing protein